MPWFRVHYQDKDNLRRHFDIERPNRDYAVDNALQWRNSDRAEGCKLLRVTSLGRIQSPKQHLAGQYRTCIGALAMAEFNIRRVQVSIENEKTNRDKQQAIQNILKAKRDITDCFRKLGLKVK